jgi:hypothetical protein
MTSATAYEVGTYEHNGYHDSYFYSIIFDVATGKFGAVETGSTAYSGGCKVPAATTDILDAARVRLVEIITDVNLAAARANRYAPTKNAVVRSLTTRGKNVGVIGTVKWIGDNDYRPGEKRVGIKVEGETKLRYLDATRVEALTPNPIDYRAIRRHARVIARRAHHNGRSSWYHALHDAGAIHTL